MKITKQQTGKSRLPIHKRKKAFFRIAAKKGS